MLVETDGAMFHVSRLRRWLDVEGLDPRDLAPLPSDYRGERFPSFLVGDEAFAFEVSGVHQEF